MKKYKCEDNAKHIFHSMIDSWNAIEVYIKKNFLVEQFQLLVNQDSFSNIRKHYAALVRKQWYDVNYVRFKHQDM